MNKLDNYLQNLVTTHAANLGLDVYMQNQMVREIAICAERGYNTRAELISLVKKAMAA